MKQGHVVMHRMLEMLLNLRENGGQRDQYRREVDKRRDSSTGDKRPTPKGKAAGARETFCQYTHYIGCLALLIFTFTATGACARELEPSGEFVSTTFFSARNTVTPEKHEKGDLPVVAARARLLWDGYISDLTSLRLEAEFNYTRLDSNRAPFDAEEAEAIIREASMKISGFMSDNIDLTVGKQRITWGKADGVNPTDNFNPNKMDALTGAGVLTLGSTADFMDKPYIWAIRAEDYYARDSRFDFVWVPRMTEAKLDPWLVRRLTGLTPTFDYPWKGNGWSTNHSQYGVRWSSVINKTDIAISFFHGYDNMPTVKTATLRYNALDPLAAVNPLLAVTGRTGIELSYPELDVIGMDFSGEVLSAGWWAEFGYFMPKKFDGGLVLVEQNGLLQNRYVPIRVMDDNYLKYTLGFDYTLPFGEGIYTNIQFARGLFDERRYTVTARTIGLSPDHGMLGSLQDYLVYRFEYKWNNDEKMLALMGFFEKGELSGFSHSSHMFMPYYTWEFRDDIDISIGYKGYTGQADSKFGSLRGNNQVFINIKNTW